MCEVLELNNENNVALTTLHQTQHCFNNIIQQITLFQQSHETNQHCLSYLIPNNIPMNTFEFDSATS